jgi:hypothetical protein
MKRRGSLLIKAHLEQVEADGGMDWEKLPIRLRRRGRSRGDVAPSWDLIVAGGDGSEDDTTVESVEVSAGEPRST